MKFIFNGEALDATNKSNFWSILPPKFLPKAKIWARKETLPAFGCQSKTKLWVFFCDISSEKVSLLL
jgi:hypothetical protein